MSGIGQFKVPSSEFREKTEDQNIRGCEIFIFSIFILRVFQRFGCSAARAYVRL
jgi:hypothetical protein